MPPAATSIESPATPVSVSVWTVSRERANRSSSSAVSTCQLSAPTPGRRDGRRAVTIRATSGTLSREGAAIRITTSSTPSRPKRSVDVRNGMVQRRGSSPSPRRISRATPTTSKRWPSRRSSPEAGFLSPKRSSARAGERIATRAAEATSTSVKNRPATTSIGEKRRAFDSTPRTGTRKETAPRWTVRSVVETRVTSHEGGSERRRRPASPRPTRTGAATGVRRPFSHR